MSWTTETGLVPRIHCDRCHRQTYSRRDRELVLPVEWASLNGQHVCGACVRRLLGPARTFVRDPSCFACGQTIIPT